jgi:hypothetical protein
MNRSTTDLAAPGFDKDEWPDLADATWNTTIESCYEPRSIC